MALPAIAYAALEHVLVPLTIMLCALVYPFISVPSVVYMAVASVWLLQSGGGGKSR